MSSEKRPIPAFYIGIVMFAIGLLVATMLHKGPFSQNITATEPTVNETLFQLDGKSVSVGDLPYVYAADLHELDTRATERRLQILRAAALDLHLKQLAREQGKPLEAVKAELIGPLSVTEEEINKFYTENQARIGRPLFEVKEAIANALKQEKDNAISQELVSGLQKQGLLSITTPKSTAPLATFDLSGIPFAGNANAPITIVEFADYRCSHCKKASQTLKSLVDTYPDQIRWVMMDFPILGGLSKQLAMGAFCAAEQKRFWDYHHELFAGQDGLTAESTQAIAAKLSLDQQKFDTCIKSEAAVAHVENTTNQGTAVGVKGTPAIFINGLAYSDGNLEDELSDTIKRVVETQTQ